MQVLAEHVAEELLHRRHGDLLAPHRAPYPAAEWGAVESEHGPEGNALPDDVRTEPSSVPPDSFHHPATSRLILSCHPMSDRNEGNPEGQVPRHRRRGHRPGPPSPAAKP